MFVLFSIPGKAYKKLPVSGTDQSETDQVRLLPIHSPIFSFGLKVCAIFEQFISSDQGKFGVCFGARIAIGRLQNH